MNKIIQILNEEGPLTGKDLIELTKEDDFSVWSFCMKSEEIVTIISGKRYLRFDRHVDGYARLSPSIVREFYNYTVIGTKKQCSEITQRSEKLQREMTKISQRKFNIAEETMRRLVNNQKESILIQSSSCFIIAGDVVFQMSHSEPRPEILYRKVG